jgi:hypothetical protein
MSHRKALILAVVVILASISAHASILGDNITIQFLYPNQATQFGLSSTGVVGPGGVNLDLFGNSSVTVYDDHVDMTGLRNSFFQAAAFNGISVQDLTNPGAFNGFSIDPASNVTGFDLSRVSISGGLLFVNYQGFVIDTSSLARVDFTTAPATVPEPGSMLLLASGLAGFAAPIRRRIRR